MQPHIFSQERAVKFGALVGVMRTNFVPKSVPEILFS
jgi:hypothetical protein